MSEENGLPKGWTETTLGEIVIPSRPRHNPQEYSHLPFIGMEHIESHSMKLLNTVPSSEMKSSSVHFWPGDVLYGRLRPYLNKVYSPDFEGLCSAEFIVFPVSDFIKSKFLLYFLNSSEFVSFASHLNEGDRPRVDFTQLSVYPVKLPPLEEQTRIVAELEKQFSRLDAGVEALKRTQAKLKCYRAAVLQAACEGRLVPTEAELARAEGRDYEPADALLERIQFKRLNKSKRKYSEATGYDTENLKTIPEGWCYASFDQVTENHDGKRIPVKAEDRKNRSGPYPYYGASGVIDFVDKYLFDGIYLLVSEDGANLLARSTPIAFKACGQFWVNNHAHIVKEIDGVNLSYLEYFLNGLNLQFYITGSAQPKLTQAALNRIPVPLPPTNEQKRIVEEVERRLSIIEEMEAAVAANLKRAERLRQALLKRAFEGKLVPQDPHDEPASALLERIRAERDAPPAHGKAGRGRRGKPQTEFVL